MKCSSFYTLCCDHRHFPPLLIQFCRKHFARKPKIFRLEDAAVVVLAPTDGVGPRPRHGPDRWLPHRSAFPQGTDIAQHCVLWHFIQFFQFPEFGLGPSYSDFDLHSLPPGSEHVEPRGDVSHRKRRQAECEGRRQDLPGRVANDHDRDQIFGLDCRQQSIPIKFWLNRPQQHDRDIVWLAEFSTQPWVWSRLIDRVDYR